MNHAAHLALQGVTCKTCHAKPPEPGDQEPPKLEMATCTACHKHQADYAAGPACPATWISKRYEKPVATFKPRRRLPEDSTARSPSRPPRAAPPATTRPSAPSATRPPPCPASRRSSSRRRSSATSSTAATSSRATRSRPGPIPPPACAATAGQVLRLLPHPAEPDRPDHPLGGRATPTPPAGSARVERRLPRLRRPQEHRRLRRLPRPRRRRRPASAATRSTARTASPHPSELEEDDRRHRQEPDVRRLPP